MRIHAESALQISTLTRLRSHKNVILNEKDAITRLKVQKKYKTKKPLGNARNQVNLLIFVTISMLLDPDHIPNTDPDPGIIKILTNFLLPKNSTLS
jgi:hypothetical protein